MAKTNIFFNNTNYSIDESDLLTATADLRQHLSTTMNGTGATIALGGTAYNIDSAKLSAATNDFITHLGIIAGNGSKVVVNGVEYNVDSTKVAGAISDLHVVLGGLHSGDEEVVVAGLYQTGAISLYEEHGAEAVESMLITPWDELVSAGKIVIDNGAVSVGFVAPENLPDKNEYGFYFGIDYQGAVFYEDGSCNMMGEILPAGTLIYDYKSIDMSNLDMGIAQVSDDGLSFLLENGMIIHSGELAQFDGDLIIPNGREITTLGSFKDQLTLTGVVIPESVTSIGHSAFSGCDGLTSVVIPESVTSIGHSAFSRCAGLTSVVIPENVTIIDDSTFFGCDGLTSVVIPDSVTSIGDYAFCDCAGLTSVVIPESVTSIGSNAFFSCTGLTEIKYNAIECTSGGKAFSNETTDGKYISLTVGKNVKKIPFLFGDITNISYAPKIVSVIFEEGSVCESIEEKAFWNCKDLQDIVIPDSLTMIGARAFFSCEGLNNITFEGTVEEWNVITKGDLWNHCVPATYVQCSDGSVKL